MNATARLRGLLRPAGFAAGAALTMAGAAALAVSLAGVVAEAVR